MISADQGVPGWSPRWAPAVDQLRSERAALLSLRGHRIVDSWLVWDLESDTWFADLPVVLQFDDHRRLELSWQKFDELSITWDTIDLAAVPTGWVDWPLTWRSQGHDALRAVNGQLITSVSGTELQFTTRPDSLTHVPGTEASSDWFLGGLLMETDGGDLHIFNALDENGLSFIPFADDRHQRRRPL